jgi:hypothetical protein
VYCIDLKLQALLSAMTTPLKGLFFIVEERLQWLES